MNSQISFLNKNLYRKYPVRADSLWQSTLGVDLPLGLISSCSISVPYDYRNVYIKSIFVNGNYINISMVHRDDPVTSELSPEITIGSFAGNVSSDYQSLNLISFKPFASGTLIVGQMKDVLSLSGQYGLSYQNGCLEGTCVFCFAPPTVSSLIVGEKQLTGAVALTLTNLSAAVVNPDITLSVDDIESISSRGDFNSSFNNCPTPVITKINTVEPDINGNIDLYGIEPIVMHIYANKLMMDTGDLTIKELCTKVDKNVPPVDTQDSYHGDIMTATQPEWKIWPQYL